MGQRVFRGKVVGRVRVAHDRCEAIGRDINALDLNGVWAQFGEGLAQAIQRRVDRIAAGIEPEIVAGDLPARAELVENGIGAESASYQLAQSLLDRILLRLEAGERISLDEFTHGHDAITALIIESGGLLPFCARLASKEISVPAPGTAPRPMNIAEKILAAKLLPGQGTHVKPGDAVLVRVDAGYSHEFTTAQVDKFLTDEYGDYKLANPTKFAVFEDHLIYATGVASMALASPAGTRTRKTLPCPNLECSSS